MILRVYVNETDITASVQMGSVKIQSSTGNRRNTASFIVNDYTIAEAQKVEIFRGSTLSSNISAGVSSFSIDDSATDLVNNVGYFLRHGDRVILGYRTANEERVTIDTVVGNTVTIVGVTARSHTKGDYIGDKAFAGVTLKNPREEIGKSEMMTYSVDASDYSTILDAQNVVDTWQSVNAREILSRIVYLFTAVDSLLTINPCESLTGVTWSGVAVTPTLDSVDKVYQNNSINIGASGAGDAKYEIVSNPFSFDGDFDEGGYDGAFTWKRNTNATAGQMDTTMLATGGFNGGKCMRISPTVTGKYVEMTTLISAYWSPTGLVIKPNTKYHLKGKIKVSGTGTIGGGARITCLMNDSTASVPSQQTAHSNLVSTDTGGQWVDLSVTFTSNSLATSLRVQPRVYNHTGSPTFIGDVYFDQITLSEVMDFSLMDKVRLWIKSPATPESYISAMTYKMYDNSGDSYSWTANAGAGGWGYDSGKFSDAVVSGAVDLTQIVKFEITLTAIQAISIGTFKIDHILATKGGFTLKNTAPGNVIFADVRSQYKKPTILIEDIAKANGFFWYVDADKDLHFFSAEDRIAPETLTDLSTNFNKLKIAADITNLRNTQTIRGGMAPEESIYTQIKVLDGKETSYRLDYPPKDLSIYISTNGGVSWGSPRTVGIENIVDETTVDFVMNFTEKTVRNGAIGLQAAGNLLKMEYYPYKDIRVKRRDQVSIDRMKLLLGGDGIFDGPVINDPSIRTFDDARSRAKAELTAYSNPVLTASFETERDGLEVGQVITITSTKYGIDAGFVIQKITASQKDNFGGFVYSITCGSTLYGLTEFFQYLLKKSSKGEIDVNELVDVVTTVDETLIMGDVLTTRKLSSAGPWYIHSRTGQYSYTLTLTEGGTSRDAYMDFFLVA